MKPSIDDNCPNVPLAFHVSVPEETGPSVEGDWAAGAGVAFTRLKLRVGWAAVLPTDHTWLYEPSKAGCQTPLTDQLPLPSVVVASL